MRTRYTKVGNYYVRRPQAHRTGPEPVTLWEIVGLTLFILGMLAAIVYALPIVMMGLLG